MKRVFVLFAHPCAESFSAALHQTVTGTLAGKGWQVDACDLYAEGFDPVLTAEERRCYHAVASNQSPVQSDVDRLLAAQALVLVFPVWNQGDPAILKGVFDRVFLPGVSFHLTEGRVGPGLQNIGKLATVTTSGGTRRKTFLAGDPPGKGAQIGDPQQPWRQCRSDLDCGPRVARSGRDVGGETRLGRLWDAGGDVFQAGNHVWHSWRRCGNLVGPGVPA